MEILATESLEKLRLECKKDPKLIERSLDDLVDDYGLSLIPMEEKLFDSAAIPKSPICTE